MKILVVGAGSIGRRHIGNLNSLGFCDIDVADLSDESLRYVSTNYSVNACSKDPSKAISCDSYDAAFILTPPAYHAELACILAEKGTHLFIEKPLSDRMEGLDRLIRLKEEKGITAMVGYNQRFNKGVMRMKQHMESGTLGRTYYIRAEVGQYLPDWRPWQDYRKSYTSRKELGGGIILDASHEVDYVLWLANSRVTDVRSMSEKVSDLEIDVEDMAEALIRFGNGVLGSIHLNMVERGYNRYCKAVGEKGSLKWTFREGILEHFDGVSGSMSVEKIEADPNQSYVDELAHFFSCIEKKEEPRTNLYTAKDTLDTALRIKGDSACRQR